VGHDILLVGADEETLHMLALVLNDAGYETRVAKSTEEACQMVRERVPDLMLMDLELPLEDGLAGANRLKSEVGRNVPIIAMSAFDPILEEARAQACFDGWLPKPFSLTTLLHFVAMADETR
jgi:DNA-binding response OmpR family regulator